MELDEKEKRRKNLRGKRNHLAQDLRTDKYRLRRVENKKKLYDRVSRQDLLKETIEREE